MLKKFLARYLTLSFLVSFILTFNLMGVNAAPGALIDEMDNVSSWSVLSGCSIDGDTSVKVSGTGSLKISASSAGVDSVVQTKTAFSKNISDLNNIELSIYVPNLTAIKTVSIFLMSDDNNYLCNYVGDWELMQGWNTIRRTKSEFISQGSTNLANITKLQLKVEAVSGKLPSVNVDKISYNVTGTAKMLLTFDDSWAGVYNYALPAMDARGMVGTSWANKSFATEGEADFMNVSQLNALYAKGWDIGNHTQTHPDNVALLSQEKRITEYIGNRDWILSNGWSRGAEHVCYPMGSFDDNLISLLKSYGTKSARTTIFGTQAEPVEDIYKLKCVAVGRDTDLNFIKATIDSAVGTSSDIFFMFHNVVDNPSSSTNEDAAIFASTQLFTQILDYIQAYKNNNKLKVVTISQWYNEYVSGGGLPNPPPAPTVTPIPTPIPNVTLTPTPTSRPIVTPRPTDIARPTSVPGNGYDGRGYDRKGYDRNGYDRKGYDAKGYDRKGYDAKGYDREGYDAKGYDRKGYDRKGYDGKGYDREGYDGKGYDRKGYDRKGYDGKGYDRNGFDKDGYDRNGLDKRCNSREKNTFVRDNNKVCEWVDKNKQCSKLNDTRKIETNKWYRNDWLESNKCNEKTVKHKNVCNKVYSIFSNCH